MAAATGSEVVAELTAEELAGAQELSGPAVDALSKEELRKAVADAEAFWDSKDRRSETPVDVSILERFLTGEGEEEVPILEPPGDYKGGQLPVMPRTIGLPTHAALPERAKKQFPEKQRRPMIRLYCFPGAADNYMLWLEFATSAPEWCEVAIYEPRAHGFRADEPWDRTLEERAADAMKVMRPAFETHAKGGVSEGAPFAFLSHGVGGQFMALVAQRLKRELSIEPLVVFANDGPPCNANTLTPTGYKLMCKDPYGFYKLFQPGTIAQVDKLGKKQGQALLNKWYRSMRMFEEHTYRAMKLEEPFHKFNCDLHVLVAQHTADLALAKDLWTPEFKKEWDNRIPLTASGEDCGNLWSKDSFRKWKDWTTEDFYFTEVPTDHNSAKNSKLVQKIVFTELGGFCGMSYNG